MSLTIIGLGLCDAKDVSVKGLERIKAADALYIESYTSLLQCSVEELEKFYGKKLIVADRAQSEQNVGEILEAAKTQKVCFLVIGDGLSATTHSEVWREAIEQKIAVEVIGNASVLTAVGLTGLQLYKFGKATSIPFLEDHPNLETPYSVLKLNQSVGMHTLALLDLKPQENRFMTIREALEILEKIEAKRKEGLIADDTLVVGCARLGCPDYEIFSGPLKELKQHDFGGPLHCLIIPGKMHFMEEEVLELHNSSFSKK